MTRFDSAPVWTAAFAAALFAFQLGMHVSSRLDRGSGGATARDLVELARYVPGRVRAEGLSATTPAPDRGLWRIRLPEAWVAAAGQRPSWRNLELFVDGQPARIALGTPDEASPLPRAVLRSRSAVAVQVECPPAPACREAIVAWRDTRFTLALYAWRLTHAPGALIFVLLGACGGLVVVRAASRAWRARTRAAFVLTWAALVGAWFWTGLYATPWAEAVLAAQVLLLAGSLILPLGADSHAADPDRPAAADQPRPWLLVGLAALLLVNVDALSRRTAVLWDAREEAWFFLRFFGSAAWAGQFGDFLPNVGSGYPVGANIVSGAYNPLYLLLAFCFPASVLSANLLYLTLQMLTLFSVFALGATFGLGRAAALFLALSIVGSGFFVGHASHFSYLSAGLGLLASLLGLRLVAAGRAQLGAGILAASAWHLGTAGSPEHLVFGAHVLLAVWAYHLVRGPRHRSVACVAPAGVVLGSLFATPALIHFFHQLPRSQRGAGLSVEAVMAGSLPTQSLLNLVAPFMGRLPAAVSVDPTIDRFHLLAISPLLVIVGVFLWWRKLGRTFWVANALGVLFTLLALGRNSPIPLRTWLAENFFLYRVGRLPAGQHSGFALFCFALASAIVLDRVWRQASPSTRRIVLALMVADFVAVMSLNANLRFGDVPADLRGVVPRFKVEYGPGDEPLLNAPRDCSFAGPGPPGQANVIPDRFSWSGYTNLISERYLSERESMRWALCGPSRLWNHDARSPHAFVLGHYTPRDIKFRTTIPPSGRLLLWAEVDDGYWALWLNGRPATLVRMPADLRGIDLSAVEPSDRTVEVVMTYRGPLSRLWRP